MHGSGAEKKVRLLFHNPFAVLIGSIGVLFFDIWREKETDKRNFL